MSISPPKYSLNIFLCISKPYTYHACKIILLMKPYQITIIAPLPIIRMIHSLDTGKLNLNTLEGLYSKIRMAATLKGKVIP